MAKKITNAIVIWCIVCSLLAMTVVSGIGNNNSDLSMISNGSSNTLASSLGIIGGGGGGSGGGGSSGSSPTQIFYCQAQTSDGSGTIVVQTWAYLGPTGTHTYWETTERMTSSNGWVLDGNYQFWSIYDGIGNSKHSGSMALFSPDNGAGSIYACTPSNTISGSTASTWSFGLSGTVGYSGDGVGATVGATLSWSVNLPSFQQTITSNTLSKASWNYYDNQALNGPNPTATKFTAGVTIETIHGQQQEIEGSYSAQFLYNNYDLWLTQDTLNWGNFYFYTNYVS